MWTKICGNTNLDDAQLAAELGADAVGFIFAPSRRRVTTQQAARIIARLPSLVETVGVFTEPDEGAIVRTGREAKLSAVQLHMALDPELLGRLQEAFEGRVKLLQVVSWESMPQDAAPGATVQRAAAALQDAFARPELFAVLLDAAVHGRSGGLGVPFAWAEAAEVLNTIGVDREASSSTQGSVPGPHLILAGGLHPGNVLEAISTLKPWGVDVVSGVEQLPGQKDAQKLKEFLRATRRD